jgi:DNA-binding GntR family transcriptional regulator
LKSDTSGVLSPVFNQATSRTETAYDQIRRRIIRLEIPPGGGFTEAQIAADLGLSKTPVREALAQLRRERLVQIDARSGCRAAPVTLKDTIDLAVFRGLLEGEAASLAAGRLTDMTQLQALERLCQASYRPDDPASIDDFLERNTSFHCTIARAGGNDRLAAALEDALQQMERLFRIGLMYSSRADEIIHEHTDLLDAIKSGDADAARSVALAQSRAAQKMIVDGMLSSPEVLSANIGASVPRRVQP